MAEITELDKIYLKFKELKETATDDCKFDRGSIESSFDNTNKLMWWINKKSEWNKVYRIFEEKRKSKYRELYQFYQTEFNLKLSTKDEFTLFIESDINYYENFNKSIVTKEILQYIDSVIETLKSRAWEQKLFIQWLIWSQGGNA